MGRIIFFIPKPQDAALVKEIFNRENDGNWELEICFATGVRQIAKREIQADAVIARGLTGYAAKRLLQDTPVIELPITAYDILRAIIDCQKEFGTQRIAIIGSPDMVCNVSTIQEITGMEIEILLITDEAEAECKIPAAKSRGVTTVIGGGTATSIAEALGLHTMMIHSGEEAICQALREAMRVALVRRQEQERAEQFRMILDYSVEGIIAVDEGGKISLINKAAAEMTGASIANIGQKAETLVPQFHIEKILKGGQAELGVFKKVRGKQMAINCVPIVIKKQTVGVVATFQPLAAIQELEGKFRTKLHGKGLVAKSSFSDIITENSKMKEIINLAQEFSVVDSNVLILGDTGVGKEVFAQSIHNASKRQYGPFVAVNCAALPENLLESELFGYVDGAFTGAARTGKMGLFEQAHRGTIFLDEVGEISPRIQARLLRVLQEREIMRLGDDRIVPVDVRVVAATNRNLKQAMQDGGFRPDLFYRLNVLNLEIPPLRDRAEDIMTLLNCFMADYEVRFQRPSKKIGRSAQELLVNYEWPGNVRELKNIAERLIVLRTQDSEFVDEKSMRSLLSLPNESTMQSASQSIKGSTFAQRKRAAQAEMIEQVLQETNFDLDKAAQLLGISRTTLWRRQKEMFKKV
ncbi:MAG: norR 1 [Firmicutes bacterium]|nr:norR 1 [Bacillota bacterium]